MERTRSSRGGAFAAAARQSQLVQSEHVGWPSLYCRKVGAKHQRAGREDQVAELLLIDGFSSAALLA